MVEKRRLKHLNNIPFAHCFFDGLRIVQSLDLILWELIL